MTRTCLDLFSGLGGFSAAFAESDAWDVVTVDLDPDGRFDPDVRADVMDLRPADLPDADVVLASPPCTDFSQACFGMKWDSDPQRNPRYIPKWDSIPGSVALVYHALLLVHELSPRYWFLENPADGMLRHIIGPPAARVDYCQYGKDRKKQTGLWGVHPPMEYATCPGRQYCGHVYNPDNQSLRVDGVAKSDVYDSVEAAKVPYDLSLAIREAIEDAYANPPPEQATLPGVQSP